MIAACPKCTARYRVDESRIGAKGAKLKCAKCQALFRVLAPSRVAPVAAAGPGPSPDPVWSATQDSTSSSSALDWAPGDAAAADRERLVIVADPDVEAGKASVAQLAQWGLQPVLVHDGVEAMLAIQRMLPRAVVLDAALPKMDGVQLCEVIKRNESLQRIGVVLVGAVPKQDRGPRASADLYAADHDIERPDLPDGLAALLVQLGMELPGRSATAFAPPAAAPPVPECEAVDPSDAQAALAPVDESLAPAYADAERLARIIVSHIALYQPQKFAEAVETGNLVDVLRAEIEEGRALFARRIDESVRDQRDFILDELLRVARQHGLG